VLTVAAVAYVYVRLVLPKFGPTPEATDDRETPESARNPTRLDITFPSK